MKRVYHLLAIFGYSFNKNKIKYKIKIYKGASKASDLNRITTIWLRSPIHKRREL